MSDPRKKEPEPISPGLTDVLDDQISKLNQYAKKSESPGKKSKAEKLSGQLTKLKDRNQDLKDPLAIENVDQFIKDLDFAYNSGVTFSESNRNHVVKQFKEEEIINAIRDFPIEWASRAQKAQESITTHSIKVADQALYDLDTELKASTDSSDYYALNQRHATLMGHDSKIDTVLSQLNEARDVQDKEATILRIVVKRAQETKDKSVSKLEKRLEDISLAKQSLSQKIDNVNSKKDEIKQTLTGVLEKLVTNISPTQKEQKNLDKLFSDFKESDNQWKRVLSAATLVDVSPSNISELNDVKQSVSLFLRDLVHQRHLIDIRLHQIEESKDKFRASPVLSKLTELKDSLEAQKTEINSKLQLIERRVTLYENLQVTQKIDQRAFREDSKRKAEEVRVAKAIADAAQQAKQTREALDKAQQEKEQAIKQDAENIRNSELKLVAIENAINTKISDLKNDLPAYFNKHNQISKLSAYISNDKIDDIVSRHIRMEFETPGSPIYEKMHSKAVYAITQDEIDAALNRGVQRSLTQISEIVTAIQNREIANNASPVSPSKKDDVQLPPASPSPSPPPSLAIDSPKSPASSNSISVFSPADSHARESSGVILSRLDAAPSPSKTSVHSVDSKAMESMIKDFARTNPIDSIHIKKLVDAVTSIGKEYVKSKTPKRGEEVAIKKGEEIVSPKRRLNIYSIEDKVFRTLAKCMDNLVEIGDNKEKSKDIIIDAYTKVQSALEKESQKIQGEGFFANIRSHDLLDGIKKALQTVGQEQKGLETPRAETQNNLETPAKSASHGMNKRG